MTEPTYYEIRVEGILDDHWAAWFEGLQVSSHGQQTTLSGPLPDESALHGALARIRDLGMHLISVRRLDPGAPGEEAPL